MKFAIYNLINMIIHVKKTVEAKPFQKCRKWRNKNHKTHAKSTYFWFLFRDFIISDIFYKIQNLNWWPVFLVITHWTYTCLSPWALLYNHLDINELVFSCQLSGNLFQEELSLPPLWYNPPPVSSRQCPLSSVLVSLQAEWRWRRLTLVPAQEDSWSQGSSGELLVLGELRTPESGGLLVPGELRRTLVPRGAWEDSWS